MEVAVAIAVQNTWLEGDETLEDVAAVYERAVAVATVPAHRLHSERSVRAPLALVRDVLDRNAGEMPEQITEQHVLDAM